MKVGKAGKAGPHAAYIARAGQYAHRLEHGEKLEATGAGNLPAWAQHNPLTFWEAADAHERANGTTYREMEIALPRELNAAQRVALVKAFVQQEIGVRHAYQWAIHVPKAADGQAQPHVHLMFSERQVDGIERDPAQYFKRYNAKAPEKGGARKGYGPHAGQTLTASQRAADLKALRGRWADLCNGHLAHAGQEARIDLRSYADQGIDQVPEAKQLPSAWRGAGRARVLELRAARVELASAAHQVREAVPDARAAVVDLEAERARRRAVPPASVPTPLAKAQAEGPEAVMALYRQHRAQEIAAYVRELVTGLRQDKDRADEALRVHDTTRPGRFARMFSDRWEQERNTLASQAEQAESRLQRYRELLGKQAKGEDLMSWYDGDTTRPDRAAAQRIREKHPDLDAAAAQAEQEIGRKRAEELKRQRQEQEREIVRRAAIAKRPPTPQQGSAPTPESDSPGPKPKGPRPRM